MGLLASPWCRVLATEFRAHTGDAEGEETGGRAHTRAMQSGSCHLIYPYSACTGEAEAEIFPGGEGKLHFELGGDGLKSLSDVANNTVLHLPVTLYTVHIFRTRSYLCKQPRRLPCRGQAIFLLLAVSDSLGMQGPGMAR
jgi:hypothetical protein